MLRVLIPFILAAIVFHEPQCDLKNVRDGYYCEKCKKALKDDELLEKEYCKMCGEGKKVDSAKCQKVKVCDKEWVPQCGMHNMKPHSKPCCGSKMCCKIDHDLSVVTYKCECGATGRWSADMKEHCKGKKAEAVCTKSGTFPHGGTEPK